MSQGARPSGLSLVLDPRWVEASCWLQMGAKNDQRARRVLFETYLPFARKLAASQYFSRRRDNYQLADLEQLAVEALLTSIERFDPTRQVPFPSFARPRILGNIADGIASMSEVGRQSSHHRQQEKERLRSLKHSSHEATERPLDTLRELTVGLALGMMLEGTGQYVEDDEVSKDPSSYDSMVWKAMKVKLADEVERLPDPHGFIVREHYQNDISFSQIAKVLGLTRGRISQLHRKALELLRKRVGKL